MAATKVIVYFFAVLVPLALVYSQDVPSPPSIPGVPNIPGLPHLPGLGPTANSDGPPEANDGAHDHHDRLFFSLIPRLTSCNYTTEAGQTCRSCSQALTCLQSNVGLIRSCHGLFRYCNGGQCSLFQGSACSATTTESTSSSSSSTSSSTSTSTTSTTTQAPAK